MSIQTISDWIYNSPVSQAIQNTSWVIPLLQSIHILAIAALFGSAILLDLKLAGFVARTESGAVVFRRYMPWLWSALGVLVMTGASLVIGEPERALSNSVFWTKMALVLVGFVLTLVMRVQMLKAQGEPERVDGPSRPNGRVKLLGLLAIAVWIAIIVCGRWIAYQH